ncbi:flagellar basal body P-ring formation chaperone FlgA [Thiolapillus sp.]
MKPRPIMRYSLLLLSAMLLLPFSSAETASQEAAQYQSHESILSVAKSFMKKYNRDVDSKSIEIETGRLDARLHLHQCDQELEAFLPSGGRTMGNMTVGVRCPGSKPWSLYVPVTVKVFDEVVVTTQALPRNTLLQRSHLKLARRNLAKLPQGYFMDPAKLVGMKLKRNLGAGLPLTHTMIKAQTVIKRGQQVMLVSRSQGLSVHMQGKAMASGAAGDLIKVKNLSSKRIVEGTVTSAGEVLVGGSAW